MKSSLIFVSLVACLLTLAAFSDVALAKRGRGDGGGSADTMHLTDEPGNWFRSDTGGLLPAAAGTPLTVISPGDKVDFV
ncbi:MAG: hypothetical protein V3W00_07100, partial [Candidatus Brocadiales bacterium]